MRYDAWSRMQEGDQATLGGFDVGGCAQALCQQGPHVALAKPQPVPQGAKSAQALERWKLRDQLRVLQPGRQQRNCGVAPVQHIHVGPGWQRGLATCKSVPNCPVCSARLRAARTEDVQKAITWWTEQQRCRVSMLTLTIRHARIHDLRKLRRGLTECWRELWTGREGRALRRDMAHYVRALDVTWGPNGWHPHLHVLVLHDEEDLDLDWLNAVRRRWAALVEQRLGRAFRPRTDSVGVHLTVNPPRAEYLLKLGLEVSEITSKTAAPGHYGSWEIARAAVAEANSGTTDTTWRHLWWYWANAMKGARHLTWSKHLRRAIKLSEDERFTAEQLELDLELVKEDPWILSLPQRDWLQVFGSHWAGTSSEWMHRPSVLLNKSRQGLEPTLAYLKHCGVELVGIRRVEVDGKTYAILSLRRRTIEQHLARMQC